jgi:DNA-binding transcriptional regulator YhcF (GntR family)
MPWKFNTNQPISDQVVERLRADIISGKYPLGSPFPSVRVLASEAGINPNTMQKALCILESDGLLICSGTVGRRVTDDESRLISVRDGMTSLRVARLVADAKGIGLNKEDLIKLIEEGWS